mmetsp:Transcript_3762/g.9744  ORF Transcript_3762/g.9744 Transcript_3762/m.9744 type:complete len:131 (-) Transcript_3762:374-766(-)|eukprot:1398855-Prymnesium_polylepis.2
MLPCGMLMRASLRSVHPDSGRVVPAAFCVPPHPHISHIALAEPGACPCLLSQREPDPDAVQSELQTRAHRLDTHTHAVAPARSRETPHIQPRAIQRTKSPHTQQARGTRDSTTVDQQPIIGMRACNDHTS